MSNEVRDIARKLLATKPAMAMAQAAWALVWKDIDKRALAARPTKLSYEVHHETEVARAAMLQAIGAGETLEAAIAAARLAVGLPDSRA